MVNWAGMGVGAAMFLFVIIRFHINHHAYDYFRNSFEKNQPRFPQLLLLPIHDDRHCMFIPCFNSELCASAGAY